jgi:signal transduction histidine kinase
LQPRILEDLGLTAALQFLARRFATDSRLDVTTEAAIGPLPLEVSIALYRAVLEALTNVHRHARASRVRIRLCEECSVIQCSIRDDGIGFDMSSVLCLAELKGSGFVYIQESLRRVGGTLVVESAPGGGTELRISVCSRLQD